MVRKLSYRSDIDGLRALAVLAVIANHLPEKYLPSGFLGVDVFFVISGFVVTASILGRKEHSFSGFYTNFLSRRVKRLLPALVACIAITGFVVLAVDPLPRDSIMTGIAALFGVANIALFNLELDYFSPSSKFNAFTHTWSLGVEEQFYVFFPFILWLTFLRLGGKTRRYLVATIISFSLLSIGLFLFFYNSHQEATYYLMPSRFWELGLGALVLLLCQKTASMNFDKSMAVVTPVAIVLLVFCFLMPLEYARSTTVLAVFLAGLLLFSQNSTLTSRALSLPPVVYVGKISYSLYLWHWPVIVLGPMILIPSWRSNLLYVVVMAALAVISYYCIERPLRQAKWHGKSAGDIGIGVGSSLFVGAFLFAAVSMSEPDVEKEKNPYPSQFLKVIPSGLPHYPTCVVDGGRRELLPDTFDKCTLPARVGASMPMIWAMGDSHAGHYQGLLYGLYASLDVGVHVIETPGSVFPSVSGHKGTPGEKIFDMIRKELKEGDIVFLSRLYLTRSIPRKGLANVDNWIEQLAVLASELQERGVYLIIAAPSVAFDFEDIRECDFRVRENCGVRRAEIAVAIDPIASKLEVFASRYENVFVFNSFKESCPKAQEYCYPDQDGQYLFRDNDHFNSLGSALLLEPFTQFLKSSGIIGSK